MFPDSFLSLVVFVLALYATPGPATLSIAASGAAFGFRRSIPYVLGVITGLVLIFLLTALGLGVLFTQYPVVHTAFKWLSLLYIVYLAYKIASSSSLKAETSSRLGFLQGIPVALLNPKAFFAIIATVAQFTQPGEAYYQSFVLVMIWAIAITLVTDLLWAYAGSYIGDRVSSGRGAKVLNVIFAVLLVVSVVVTMFFQ